MNKKSRLLDILFSLFFENPQTKNELMIKYDVSERTIFRDLELIKTYLEEYKTDTISLSLIYDNEKQCYSIELTTLKSFTIEEVVALSKILISSRAFSAKEINHLIDKLVSYLVDETEQQIARSIIIDELGHYTSLTHKKDILPLIKSFVSYIDNHDIIQFDYRRSDNVTNASAGQPLSLFFSEFYFYIMFFSKTNNKHLSRRLDRFLDIKKLKKGKRDPNTILNDSEYRKKTYFMLSSGKEQVMTFNYFSNPEVVLDRFPHATVVTVDSKNSRTQFKVRAYENGMMNWVLSQGANVEVISPISFKESIKQEILNMQKRYSN